jgi:hypothetical protein
MPYVDRPLPEALKLSRLRPERPRDKRLDNLRPGSGRRGIQNKICRDLKEGLLEGAIRHGYDGNGLHGLVGYCHHLAERYPKTYGYLLGKLLPYNLNASVANTGISTVRIVSVPVGVHLNAEQLKRVEAGQSVLDLQPQPLELAKPLDLAEPVASVPAPETPEGAASLDQQLMAELRTLSLSCGELLQRAQRMGLLDGAPE